MSSQFYAGESYVRSEKTIFGKVAPSWLNPWYYFSSGIPPSGVTRSQIQANPFWSMLVNEIERSTNSIILEKGKHRKQAKKLVTLAIASGLLDELLEDDKSGDVSAMLAYFRTQPKRLWEMRQVALALVVTYVGIWRKASRKMRLEPHEIDIGLFIDQTAMNVEKRRQEEMNGVYRSLAELGVSILSIAGTPRQPAAVDVTGNSGGSDEDDSVSCNCED